MANGDIGSVIEQYTYHSTNAEFPLKFISIGGDIYAGVFSYAGNARLVTFSCDAAGDISNGWIDQYDYAGTSDWVFITHISGTVYALVYRSGDIGYIKTISIASDGTIGSVITTKAMNTGVNPDKCQALFCPLIHHTGTIYALIYQCSISSRGNVCQTWSISDDGATISKLSTNDWNSGNASCYPTMTKMGGNYFIAVSPNYADPVYAISYSINPSTGAITRVDTVSLGNAQGSWPIYKFSALTPLNESETVCAVACITSGSTRRLATVSIDGSGNLTLEDTSDGLYSGARPFAMFVIAQDVYAVCSAGTLTTLHIADDGSIGAAQDSHGTGGDYLSGGIHHSGDIYFIAWEAGFNLYGASLGITTIEGGAMGENPAMSLVKAAHL